VTTIATAFVHDFGGMLVTRVVLGLCEATINPSLMLITSQWYTKSEQAPRFALWHCAPGIGQITGGYVEKNKQTTTTTTTTKTSDKPPFEAPQTKANAISRLLSFAFQTVPHDGRYMVGWRLMFLSLGIVTLVVGIITYLWLPDSPMKAKFLRNEEKVAILRHVSVNMTGISNQKARPREILEAIADPQIYLLVLPGIFVSGPSSLPPCFAREIAFFLLLKTKPRANFLSVFVPCGF
jgi:MFS family permease